MSPTLFEQPRGFFNLPQETDEWKSSEMGPYSFSSLSKTTTKSNCFQMSLQRQHFLVSYLKTLSVGPARVLVRPGCWSGQGVGSARVLVWPGCWSGQGVGLAGVLVRPGCWSGSEVGPARVLVWPGCWSGRGVGPAGVLVWPGCWSGQGVGPARVLVWPGCWSGQGVGPASVCTRDLPLSRPALSQLNSCTAVNWVYSVPRFFQPPVNTNLSLETIFLETELSRKTWRDKKKI